MGFYDRLHSTNDAHRHEIDVMHANFVFYMHRSFNVNWWYKLHNLGDINYKHRYYVNKKYSYKMNVNTAF